MMHWMTGTGTGVPWSKNGHRLKGPVLPGRNTRRRKKRRRKRKSLITCLSLKERGTVNLYAKVQKEREVEPS